MQTQGEVASTQIIVQPMVASPQSQNGYVYQQCPAIARFIGPQYWPAWSFILGAIGFFCIIGGLQSLVTNCDQAGELSGCNIFETYIFFIFYLPNILILLIGIGIALAAHYNQTGWVLKCCLPCAMVALFIWASIICYYLGILKDAIDLYCADSANDTESYYPYICTNLKSDVTTTYAGQVILLIYLVLVTLLGCVYGCKQSNTNNMNKGNAPLVVVQTSAPVGQPIYGQPYVQQQPYIQQQTYVQQQPYVQQGYTQQGYPQ